MPQLIIRRRNFRDCGGFSTASGASIKYGTLFRSGSLDHLVSSEKKIVIQTRLATIIDLRPQWEQSSRRRMISGTRRISVPFDIDPIVRKRIAPLMWKRHAADRIREEVTEVYAQVPLLCSPHLEKLFSILGEPAAYPLCINCRAGKDRTGFTIALILSMAGVGSEEILRDYLFTNEVLLPRVYRISKPLRLLSLGILPAENMEAALGVYREYFEAAFGTINREFGSVPAYLEASGVPRSLQKRIRGLLCGS